MESSPVNNPISPYAASKKAAEVMSYTYHYLYGIDVSIVRYFTVYGPAGRPDMSMLRFINSIDKGEQIELFGDGSQSRDFTYISDIARGTVAALKEVGYEIINLGGGGIPVRIEDVISMIEKRLNKKAKISKLPFHIADLKVTQANVYKAKSLLLWEPKIQVEEGVNRTVDWYIENRKLCNSLKF